MKSTALKIPAFLTAGLAGFLAVDRAPITDAAPACAPPLHTNVTHNAQALNALVMNQKTYGLHVYENVGHAFHNDTGPQYNRAAACDAWTKTIDFYQKHLLA